MNLAVGSQGASQSSISVFPVFVPMEHSLMDSIEGLLSHITPGGDQPTQKGTLYARSLSSPHGPVGRSGVRCPFRAFVSGLFRFCSSTKHTRVPRNQAPLGRKMQLRSLSQKPPSKPSFQQPDCATTTMLFSFSLSTGAECVCSSRGRREGGQ